MIASLDKKNFFLMLSLYLGKDIPQQQGFIAASKEVRDKEQEWVSGQWELLYDTGVFEEVVESVEWFSQVLAGGIIDGEDDPDVVEHVVEQTKTIILAYGVALVQKLMANEKIAIIGEAVLE